MAGAVKAHGREGRGPRGPRVVVRAGEVFDPGDRSKGGGGQAAPVYQPVDDEGWEPGAVRRDHQRE